MWWYFGGVVFVRIFCSNYQFVGYLVGDGWDRGV